MGKKLKYTIFSIVILLLLIQLIPVNQDNPLSDPNLEIEAPVAVKNILENSCYDCHSHQTKWPFYSKIAPISWLITAHVEEGRERLNFSEWSELSQKVQERKMAGMIEEIMGDEMPLSSYLLLHPGAKLSNDQKQILKDWTVSGNQDQ